MSARDEFEQAVRDAVALNEDRLPVLPRRIQPHPGPPDGCWKCAVYQRRAELREAVIAYITERQAPSVIEALEDLLRKEAS